MDKHGNINAAEGQDRCQCGCKYWENDKCIDCGTLIEIAKIRSLANESRFLLDMSLNVQVSSMVFYDLGWRNWTPLVGDATEIAQRHRLAGHIV